MNTHGGRSKIALLLVPLAVLFLLCAGAAKTQEEEDAPKASEALERTDEIIDTAKDAIEESRSQKARLTLDVAEGLQAKAWSSYRGNEYRMALKLTAKAREEAWHALALARSDRQFEQNNSRIAEETRDRLARLRDRMMESGVRDEQATKLMEQARNLLDKSHLNAQQLRYQLALKLAANARDLTSKADERVRNTRVLKEAAERRFALLERLVDRARERAGAPGQERARDQIAIAEGQIEKAREFLDAGRYREAMQASERCEKTLRNSVRLMPLAPAGDPQNRLEETHRLLERAEEMASGNGKPAGPGTLGTMDQARAMIRRAEDALGAGRTAEGLDLLERSRGLLRGAIRVEAGEMTRETIMMRVERIESLRDETRNLAEKCPEPGVQELMERAQEHLRLARDHAESGRLEPAAAEIAVARNMYQRIGELCAR
jgi:tetratricopeptide (TPR) repeat protein